MLFVYCGVDNYLRDAGRLGFVITQTVFKTVGAGDGFRQFHYTHGNEDIALAPCIVHDLSHVQVFEGATNRTAVFVCQKTRHKFSYPVPYMNWEGPSFLDQGEALERVLKITQRKPLEAVPIQSERANSPWLTAPLPALQGVRKVLGRSEYIAREGVNTGGLNSCYWVRVLRTMPNNQLVVENLHDVGKVKLDRLQKTVEPDLVFPMLRGRDVTRWRASPSCFIIAPQDHINQREGIAEAEMKRKYPKTFEYLKHFEKQLSARRDRKYYPEGSPFYTMRNMAAYSLAPWKVVWREQSSEFQAAVVGDFGKKTVLPDHKLMSVPCRSSEEAHYLAALLGSSPSKLVVISYVVSTATARRPRGIRKNSESLSTKSTKPRRSSGASQTMN